MNHVGTRLSRPTFSSWMVQDRRLSLLCFQLVAKVLLLRVVAVPGGVLKPSGTPVSRVFLLVQFSPMTDGPLDVAVTPIDGGCYQLTPHPIASGPKFGLSHP